MLAMTTTVEARETERLSALNRMELMDTAPEPEFDELVETAAAICEVPISLVTLVDERRQWFKAAIGLTISETPREVAFCAHAIKQPELMLVEDATSDPRFAANPLVTGENHFRFYAGMPISSPDGFALGTLCVLDRVPRKLTTTQVAALKVLGRQVNARMELRLHRLQMERALAAAEEARAKLAASEHRFMTFMDSAPFIAFLKDADGRIIFYNQMTADTFGVTREEWLGKTDHEIYDERDAARFRAHDMDAVRSNSLRIMQEEWVDKDGVVSQWCSYKFPCAGADGSTMVGGFWINVTEQLRSDTELRRQRAEIEAANVRLSELAATDSLTGLANRRVFDERLAVEFAQAKRKKRELSVMILDLDGFKRRNDLYGHQQGDAALRQFARLLEEATREGDLAARYGGEEFVLLLPETDDAQAAQLADRILEKIRAAVWEDEPLTTSIGAASLDAAMASDQRLVSLADEALYAAKRAGRDRFVSYKEYYKQVVEQMGASSS